MSSESSRPGRGALRDDRVLLATRITHGLLALVGIPFFAGLTFYPEITARNFAWPLAPRMSAMLF